MKKIPLLLSGLLLLSLTGCGTSNSNGSEKIKIGITQIVEHAALDATKLGFTAALADAGYKDGDNIEIDYQIAQGDMNTNTTIAQKLVSDKSDLILAISTASAQAVIQQTKDIPILFSAVTDPLGANLVDNLAKPGGNVTGMSDTHPDAIKSTMSAIKDFFPQSKKVGVIYNSGEQNSVVNVTNAKKELEALGLDIVEATVTNTSEVKQAADSLVGKVDVIYLPKDNTVVSALDTVVAIADANDIPLFVGETEALKKGAFAAVGFEYFDLGYQTGKMAVEILEGKKPGDLAVAFPEKLDLMINPKGAEAEGIQLTDIMKEKAIMMEE